MSKTVKRTILVAIIVLALLVAICLGYEHFKTEPVDANQIDTNLVDENAGLDNVINDLFEETDTEEVEEEEPEQVETDTEQADNKEEGSYKSEEKVEKTETVTSREDKAINLVEKEWGDDDGVYFSCLSIDNEGRYTVSVNDSKTTRTLAFYTVDVDKETVEIQ